MKSLAAGLLCLAVLGCSSRASHVERTWSTRVGYVSYSQVVAELGPPTSQETIEGGRIVAEWKKTKSFGSYHPKSYTPYPGGMSSYSGGTGPYVIGGPIDRTEVLTLILENRPVVQTEVLMLIFGSEQILEHWNWREH